MKILIIDDNPADRKIYKKYIEEYDLFENLQIEECGSLSKAFQKLKEKEFDLILLDLGLPESEGIQTITLMTEELKNNKIKTPIIILTGLEDHIIGTEAFKHGIRDFLIKGEVIENKKELSRSINYATYSLNFKKRKK
jgi:response regulator of citrate/malate metabolism